MSKIIANMLVWHKQLGPGKVISVMKDGCYLVAFLFYAPNVEVKEEALKILRVGDDIRREIIDKFEQCLMKVIKKL